MHPNLETNMKFAYKHIYYVSEISPMIRIIERLYTLFFKQQICRNKLSSFTGNRIVTVTGSNLIKSQSLVHAPLSTAPVNREWYNLKSIFLFKFSWNSYSRKTEPNRNLWEYMTITTHTAYLHIWTNWATGLPGPTWANWVNYLRPTG